jgi:predicted acetyltransferase
MPISVRPVDELEFDQWFATENAVFGEPTPRPELLAAERTVLPRDRTVAAYDGDTMVGTAGSFPFAMTLPGGSTLPVAGVTAVTVAPTHRRRGILAQMMEYQLDDVAGRDEPIAVLNASESSIYGRFGYGIAELFQTYRIDAARSAFAPAVPERSTPLRMLGKARARAELPAVYDLCRPLRPGMLDQSEAWWGCVLGDVRHWKGGGDLFVVIADADPVAGTGPGYVIYRLDTTAGTAQWKLTVFDFEAADAIVEAQLWRFLFDVDLVATVEVEARPLDCNLRWWFREPRQVKVTNVGDYLWVRLLDVERSLAARSYPVAGELVVGVSDPFRPDNDGVFALRAGPGRASCERARTAVPDVELGIDDLGAVYLGQTRLSALAAVGRVRERTPGGLARADALFRWPVAPACVTRF